MHLKPIEKNKNSNNRNLSNMNTLYILKKKKKDNIKYIAFGLSLYKVAEFKLKNCLLVHDFIYPVLSYLSLVYHTHHTINYKINLIEVKIQPHSKKVIGKIMKYEFYTCVLFCEVL